MFPSPVGEVSNLAGVEGPINSKLYYSFKVFVGLTRKVAIRWVRPYSGSDKIENPKFWKAMVDFRIT